MCCAKIMCNHRIIAKHAQATNCTNPNNINNNHYRHSLTPCTKNHSSISTIRGNGIDMDDIDDDDLKSQCAQLNTYGHKVLKIKEGTYGPFYDR